MPGMATGIVAGIVAVGMTGGVVGGMAIGVVVGMNGLAAGCGWCCSVGRCGAGFKGGGDGVALGSVCTGSAVGVGTVVDASCGDSGDGGRATGCCGIAGTKAFAVLAAGG